MALADNTAALQQLLSEVDNLPSAGGGGANNWALLKTVTIGDDVSIVNITADENGAAISCEELSFVMLLPQVNTALTLYFDEAGGSGNNRPSVAPANNVANQVVIGYITKLGGYIGLSQGGVVKPYVGGYNYSTKDSKPVADGNLTGIQITAATWQSQTIWPGTIIYLFGR